MNDETLTRCYRVLDQAERQTRIAFALVLAAIALLLCSLFVIGCESSPTVGWDPATMRCRTWQDQATPVTIQPEVN